MWKDTTRNSIKHTILSNKYNKTHKNLCKGTYKSLLRNIKENLNKFLSYQIHGKKDSIF